MLLLDTEGLASTERSTNVDIKIFSLSLLLASLFVYNQMGPITENAIEELSLVANLTNYIRISQNKNAEQDFKSFFPSFFWVLRDFYHDLEGQTPKQYLEECLQPSPGLSSEVLKKNGIREAILKHFKERECFTLVRPVAEEAKLAHIDSLKFEELKTEFRKGVTAFLKELRKRLKTKSVNGKVLNPGMFLQLALEYTEALNHSETPTVLTAIDRVVQAEANKIQEETYDTFCLQLDTLVHEDNVPMPKQLFTRLVRQTYKRNLIAMQKQMAPILSFGEIVKESEKFSVKTRDIVARKFRQNYSASYFMAVSMLNKLYASVAQSFPADEKAVETALENVRRWH